MTDHLNVGNRLQTDSKPLSRFRKMYRPLTDAEKIYHDAIKDQAAKLEFLINGLGTSRELSLALTALEDTVMRAVRDLTSDRRATNNASHNGKEKISDAYLLKTLQDVNSIIAD